MGHCFTDPRHTLTGLLGCAGRLDDDWSADYRMYDTIDTPRLFEPILQRIRRTIPAEAPRILSATSPSHCDLQQLRAVREMLGDDSHTVVLCGDAHYTTETLLRGLDHDVTYIGRFRKDAALFEAIDADGPCGPGRPRRYGPKRPTPEELRKDKSIPWSEAKIRRGKKLVTIRYKRHAPVTWRPAGEKRTVQVVVIAPLRRGRGKQGQWKYTQPAYLLCTDADLPIESLTKSIAACGGGRGPRRSRGPLFRISRRQAMHLPVLIDPFARTDRHCQHCRLSVLTYRPTSHIFHDSNPCCRWVHACHSQGPAASLFTHTPSHATLRRQSGAPREKPPPHALVERSPCPQRSPRPRGKAAIDRRPSAASTHTVSRVP